MRLETSPALRGCASTLGTGCMVFKRSIMAPVSGGIKKKAQDERDAAKERLNFHELTCPTCTHNQRNPHSVK